MTTQNWQTNRYLESRSYLKFEFPTVGTKTINIVLPFFQNPIIRESKKGNFVKYKPLGRSSSLYTYTGAESRELSVDFELNLSHLSEYTVNFGQSVLTPISTNIDAEKEKFKAKALGLTSTPNNLDKSIPQSVRTIKSELASLLQSTATAAFPESKSSTVPYFKREVYSQDNRVVSYKSDFGVDSLADRFRKFVDPNLTTKEKVVEVVLFWVNLIRTSVINNSENPLLGPPIIRLNHGVLYRSIPCVCTDYSLSDDARAGMEVSTLMPKVIKITLKLEEVRAGNFERFVTNNKITNPDGLPGWESVINAPYTLDPQK
jgi:hypothetical protein